MALNKISGWASGGTAISKISKSPCSSIASIESKTTGILWVKATSLAFSADLEEMQVTLNPALL